MPAKYRKTSASESVRLQQICGELRGQGYTTQAIMTALGVSESTVGSYLRKAGFTGKIYHQRTDLPALGTIEWRDVEQPAVPVDLTVDYHLSLPARGVKDNLRYFREINGVVRMAYDVSEALGAGDETWVTLRRNDLTEFMEYLRRMVQVIDDPEARARARTDQNERDDLRPTLRQVAG